MAFSFDAWVDAINAELQAHGISRTKLAAAAGMQLPQVSRYLNKKKGARTVTLEKIEAALAGLIAAKAATK